jgi:heat shock 70kDa protein 1/2/6/8
VGHVSTLCVRLFSPAASSSPTPRSNNTPAASQFATPRSEPIPVERIITPADVTTLFLRSLLQSAEAASAAGIRVLQLLEDAGAAALCAATNTCPTTMAQSSVGPDRTQLVVDLGASSLSLSLLAVRQGLFHHLTHQTPPAHHLEDAGRDAIDDRLLKFFAKDFTKKTSVQLKVAPASASSDAVADLRAEARLRLALLHTKRTIAASSFGGGSNTATCALESLKDGLDYTGSINRLRFDMEAAPIYATVVAHPGELLQRAGLDWVQVDEIVYAGGSACLSGLDAVLVVRPGEDTTTPFITTKETQACVRQPSLTLCRFSSDSDKVHSRLQRRLKQIGRSRI